MLSRESLVKAVCAAGLAMAGLAVFTTDASAGQPSVRRYRWSIPQTPIKNVQGYRFYKEGDPVLRQFQLRSIPQTPIKNVQNWRFYKEGDPVLRQFQLQPMTPKRYRPVGGSDWIKVITSPSTRVSR